MTEQEQIKALAELDGYGEIRYSVGEWYAGDYKTGDLRVVNCNYLHSYNAIIPLIQKQSFIGLTQFVDFLCNEILDDHYDGSDHISQPDTGMLFKATPAQLCEALLRATGKWKD